MLTKAMTDLLTRCSCGQLPKCIDWNTPNVDVEDFKMLRDDGLIKAVDASAGGASVFLKPEITLKGCLALEASMAVTPPWWRSFDRRIAVLGVLLSVLGFAATVGLLSARL